MPYALLNQKHPYFRNLSAAAQKRFVERVQKFMTGKYFVGHEGLVITEEIRILISAAAVQLTFGLKDYTIPHLRTINVFPKIFYSRYFETSFKGLTTDTGVLSISWDDFKDGYADYGDKLNLGLHELAHALNIDLFEEGDYDAQFYYYFGKWKKTALNELDNLRAGHTSFFRKYAVLNINEFLAVCIEHFFEAPSEFLQQLPVLYGHTVLMLNQDPENKENDYKVKPISEYFKPSDSGSISVYAEKAENRISENIPYDKHHTKANISRIIGKHGVYIAMATTIIGLFIGIPLLIWFMNTTIVSLGTLLLLIFICGIIGLIQWGFVKNLIDMEYNEFAMYSFAGFAMCLINFLFLLNMSFPMKERTETYSLDNFPISLKDEEIEVELDNRALSRNLTKYLNDNFDELPPSEKLSITYTTGLLGFDSIKDCRFH